MFTPARGCGARSGGTISRPRITDGHVLDTVAHVYGLLPEFHGLWLEPLQVMMLASELPPCDACAGVDARFEIPGAPGGWVMALCRRCALETTGNRRLGPASAQQLVILDEVPTGVRTRCEAVATEIGQPSPWRSQSSREQRVTDCLRHDK
jgi:hypothetical protein